MKASRWLLSAACLFIMTPLTWAQNPAMRERLPFNAGWRFQKNDPPGSARLLSYDRIKDWVNASGSEFVSDASRRTVHPKGNPGENVPYLQRDFDDRSWRQLNLPHDWGVEGPFNQASRRNRQASLVGCRLVPETIRRFGSGQRQTILPGH